MFGDDRWLRFDPLAVEKKNVKNEFSYNMSFLVSKLFDIMFIFAKGRQTYYDESCVKYVKC